MVAARSASHLTTGPGPTDPSRPTRGSSGDSPRSVSTTPPSRRPVPGRTSATSSSPIHASLPRSLVVDVVNIVERRAAPANHQGVRFSVAINGKFTVATNMQSGLLPRNVAPYSCTNAGTYRVVCWRCVTRTQAKSYDRENHRPDRASSVDALTPAVLAESPNDRQRSRLNEGDKQ